MVLFVYFKNHGLLKHNLHQRQFSKSMLNFMVLIQSHFIVFYFNIMREIVWVKTRMHTYNHMFLLLVVCAHLLGSCLHQPLGVVKKKQSQCDSTTAQTKSTFFNSLFFFIFSVLIECLATNNVTFPSVISLCGEPTSFFLISRKEPH